MSNHHEEEVQHAVQLLDDLLAAVDGGRPVGPLGSYDASTILALLTDQNYRSEVLACLPDFDHVRA